MKDKIVRWSKKKYTAKQRILSLLPEAVLFLFVIPYALFLLSRSMDGFLGLSPFSQSFLTLVLGALLGVSGFLFAAWSVIVQFTKGEGTPVPLMATQRLITDGPYSYCRNPMALGTFIFYLGIGTVIGSPSFIALVTLFTAILLVYIKRVEERELEERFGEEYLKYKATTSFFIPRIAPRRR